jgi:hypothetical protein
MKIQESQLWIFIKMKQFELNFCNKSNNKVFNNISKWYLRQFSKVIQIIIQGI